MIDFPWAFLLLSIPAMLVLGARHGLDVDHITAIDNLVRLHNASGKSKLVGAGFSSGHMISVLAEMILIIYTVGGFTCTCCLLFWGGVVGAAALGTVGAVNMYSVRKWGKSGSSILATKILGRTGRLGPLVSSLVTGMVFGLGFDTATQISAITLSAAASAATGIQVALVLAGFFALGMIPVDTLDGMLVRSAIFRMFNAKAFRYMTYSLSGLAVSIAAIESYGTVAKAEVLPTWAGPAMAVGILSVLFAYAFVTGKKGLSHSHVEERREEIGS